MLECIMSWIPNSQLRALRDGQSAILQTLLAMQKDLSKMSAQLDRLAASVTAVRTVADSAIALIKGLADQIRNLPADQAAITAFADQLDAAKADLGTAVEANTPAEPE